MKHTVDAGVRRRAIERCRERKILIPTFAQMRSPAGLDPSLLAELTDVDMQAVHPLNLFRITWRNDPDTGAFGDVNHLELPSELTGVPARIVGLVGEHFPTGAHKVGAAFGCLVPRLVTGEFDPTTNRAVWPSTGNYCRGGAFDSALLGCRGRGDPPGGDEPRALRLAGGDRRRDHPDSGKREQRQGDLRRPAGSCAAPSRKS